MSSIPDSNGRRRSQRQSNLQTLQNSQDNTVDQAASLRGKKRKKESRSISDDPAAPLPGPKEALEELGVTVGDKTSRERLLELLAQRAKPKKPRLAKKTPKAIRSKTSRNPKPEEHGDNSTPTSENANPQETVEYSVFHESQLINMLRDVGLDTRGLDKEALVTACKAYHDLITIPEFSIAVPQAGPSTSKSGACSSQGLPSVEHGCFDFPRPTPTLPIVENTTESRQTKDKGKGKEVTDDTDEDWIPPSDGRMSDISEGDPEKNTKKNDPQEEDAEPTSLTGVNEHRTSGGQGADSTTSDQTKLITWLKTTLLETQDRVEELESEYKTLSSLVKRLVKDRDKDKKDVTNTCGGRVAARLRFHVETLLGTGSNKALPQPASLVDRKKWNTDRPLDDVEFDLDPELSPPDGQEGDAFFPFRDGPGHLNATPQQLSIMWQMMNTVGVTSFQPDFSTSASSKHNKWLWELALKIFYKLVECGEYTGIPLGTSGISVIKKHLATHIQTLMKRYRQENWDAAWKKRSADEVRRGTRMRHLKGLREGAALSRDRLWPLAPVMIATCSDDKTVDKEGTALTEPSSSNRPCLVRRLEWRSSDCAMACSLLDEYRGKVADSIPGVSPGQRGRRPRERIRRQDGPLSRIEAPVGLPVDCYSEEWLNGLSALERNQLEIHSTPILQKMISTLHSLM